MADILSQDEVDLLLNAVSEGEVGAEPAMQPQEALQLAVYDFRRPERVSKEQIKGLQSLFDAFAREVSIMFPPFLRTVVRLDLTSLDQLTYDEFILSVSRPTSLSVISMAPLDGTAVIEMSPSMVFPIVDRVLGGKGMTLSEPRELTEIENRIVQRIVMMMLDCLKRSWAQLIEFDLEVLQQESDPLIVQIVAGSEMVILVGYEIHVGETTGSMNMCIPLMMLNPILDQISQQAHFTRRVAPEIQAQVRGFIAHAVQRANLSIDSVLGQAKLTLSDVARLQVGDVVQLNTTPNEPVRIEAGGVPIFRIRPGRVGEQSAVQVVSLIRTEEG